MNDHSVSKTELTKKTFGRISFFFPVWLVLFFLPAGTFAFWEAWVVLGILFIPMMLVSVYLLKSIPEVLERRLRTKEKEAKQQLIIKLFFLFFILTFIVPGLDKRFGWSRVPVAAVIVADVVVLFGYGLCFLVMKENRYASRIIEVEQDQKVVSSGLYSIVRHPMYLGALLMCLALPLALGSYWAIIPSVVIIPILAARIKNEESLLKRELEGYQEYLQKTKYRLIPGIW